MTFPVLFSYLKRNLAVSLSGLVIVVCVGYNFVRSEQIDRLDANYDDMKVRRSRILKNFKFGSDLERDLAVMRDMKKDAESRLFRPENLAVNQRYFYQLENSTDVRLQGLQQKIKPMPTGKANKQAMKKAAKSKYREIVYDMNVSGSYENVLRFLRELEGGSAFARLVSLKTSASRSNSRREIIMQLSVEVLGVKP